MNLLASLKPVSGTPIALGRQSIKSEDYIKGIVLPRPMPLIFVYSQPIFHGMTNINGVVSIRATQRRKRFTPYISRITKVTHGGDQSSSAIR